jgi:hypothetical protein
MATIHDLHDSTRDLVAKLVTSGMSAGAVANLVRAAMDASTAPHDARWQAFDQRTRVALVWSAIAATRTQHALQAIDTIQRFRD